MKFATKLGLSAASAALIVGPLLGAAVFFEARSALQERIEHEQVQSATSVMREIDTAMYRAYLDATMIAADDLLREAVEHPQNPVRAQLMDEMEERDRLTGPWKALMVFDQTGRALFGPKPLGDAKHISAYPANRIAFDHALKGETYHSGQIICPQTHQPFVIFAAPVYARDDEKKVVGVVIAQYVWESIQRILDHVDPVARVHLLNSERDVIGRRSDDSHPLLRIPLLAQPAKKNGPATYGVAASSSHGEGAALTVELGQSGVQDYHGSGWILLMEQPLDIVFASVSKLASNTASIVFVTLLLQAALLAVLGRLFLRPMASLLKGVRQVAGGNLDGKMVVRSKDEFGELADNFNVMTDNLRERTQQLLQAQDELLRKEKLAVLGQVAGSVGHELRNPLGVMSNAVYFLQTVLAEADDSVKEYLEIIKSEIAGSERIVSDLLDSVRTKPPQPEIAGVRELLVQTLRKLVIPPSVSVKLDIPETLPPLRVDPQQIHQVLRNLISNAVEAMPEGGTLEIRAVENRPDSSITVSVRDSGSGMAPEVLAKLFQPLFTTKARGIGLGLVVVKNLTQANGGSVQVQSEAGKGSQFAVTLPAAMDGGSGPQ